MTTAADISVREIVERLEDRLDELVPRLLPGGRRVGAEWDVRGSKSPIGPCAVVMRGHKRGAVGFFGGLGRQGGDILDLIQEVYGTDKRGAVEWAKGYLGIAADKPLPVRTVAPRPAKVEDPARVARRLETIAGIWSETQPIEGTHAEAYLRARGLSGAFGWPGSLRFHPALEWTLGRIEDERGRVTPGPNYPALVAAVEDHEGELRGLWRIYLDPDQPRKIDRDPAKVGMGQKRGHAVRFGEAEATVYTCEGVETGLAVRQRLLRLGRPRPVWPALDAGNLVSLAAGLPPEVERLIIVADGDNPPAGSQNAADGVGREKAREAVLAARAAGRKAFVEVVRGGDFLDLEAQEQANGCHQNLKG